MRFDQIEIPAFGPFTDFALSLPETKYDVHLIYGPNEAGKSSLLRGLSHLLYGIPTRTNDSFLHQNPQLRIGATISNEDQSLTFVRKKGTKNTLLDSKGNTLPDASLVPFLGSVDEAFFATMFGLDTDSLRRGADSLLAGEGDLGSAIFSASRGGAPVNEAIKNLEAEAHTLFKERARNTEITALLRELKEAEAAAKAETISTNRWKTLKTALREAESRFEEKDRLRREHLARREFVSRCLQAIPVLQKLRRLEEELSEIDLPDLPSDFVKRVRARESALAAGKQALQLHLGRRESLDASLAQIADPKAILDRRADFEFLHRRSDHSHETREALPGLETKLISLMAEVGEEKEIADFPEIAQTTVERLKSGSEELDELSKQSFHLTSELKNLADRIKKSRASLEKFTASDELETLAGNAELADQFATEKSTYADDLSKRSLLEGRLELLRERLEIEGDPRKLRVPDRKTIEQAERDRLACLEQIRDLEKELKSCRDDLSGEQAALDHLATQAAIFSPADLRESRESRDELWQEILKSGAPDSSLTPAIAKSDEIADALHRDAEVIAKAASHQARLATMRARRKDLESDLEKAQAALESWTTTWEKDHAKQLPTALMAWREDWEKFCELTEEFEVLVARIARIEEQEKELLKKLGGSDFSKAHRQLRAKLGQANQDRGEEEAIRKQLASDELKFDQLTREEEERAAIEKVALGNWQELCEAVNLPADQATSVTLRELDSRLLTRRRLLELLAVENDIGQRKEFIAEYDSLLQATAIAFKEQANGPALQALFEGAKEDESRRQILKKQLAELKLEEPKLTLQVSDESEALDELKKQAWSEDLEEVITRFEARLRLQVGEAAQKESLERLAKGKRLEDFLEEVKSQDQVALEQEDAGLEEEEVALQNERDRAKEAWDDILREERELSEASDLAAQHRQHAADAKAAIVTNYQRFRQLHHAIDFLKQQVESYREKAQGPMVEKTSQFFKTLTDGAFDRVVARADDKDIPQLLAVRATGEEVPTDGLSEGTRDQLYLALRFAAIDLHLEDHPPMPLILDDLLMTFDDDRARALFPVLEELGRKTQILIFTHHAHLRELVGKQVAVHNLRSSKK